VVHNAIPLEDMPAVDGIQNMTFKLLGGSVGEKYFNT
jgi:hypothetical protein